MAFRLVPKSVTLKDLERRNVPCFSLFHRIRLRYVVVKQLLGLSVSKSTFDSLWPY